MGYIVLICDLVIIFWPFGRLSAVMTIGAATLADVFDPMERGTKVVIPFRIWILAEFYPRWGSIMLRHFWEWYVFSAFSTCSQ